MLSGYSPSEILAKIQAERAKRAGVNTFATFVKQAWEYVPSCDPLTWNWHMDALCLHYEAVARGEIERLVVNIAPGHAKSVINSVLWPAWIWTWWPRCQIMTASYGADLATRDSMRTRSVLESDWYRETFSGPAGWSFRRDLNKKNHYANTLGGERLAIGVGGTGRRAHVIALDDPIDAVDINSKATRDSTNEWLDHTLALRFIVPRAPKMALVMQRLHQEDPAGYLLAKNRKATEGHREIRYCEHLCLPTEFDPARRSITYSIPLGQPRQEFWRDPREKKGELLFPERFTPDVVEGFKISMTPGGYESQHGQSPVPAGGIIFNPTWWNFWRKSDAPAMPMARPTNCDRERPARELPTKFQRILLTVDANFKDATDADPVSIQAWGETKADTFLLDYVNAPLGFNKTVAAIRAMHARIRTAYGRVTCVLVELKANGDAIVNTLAEEIAGVIGIEPDGGKEARAWSVQPRVQAGNCYLPEGAPYVDAFVAEHTAFPRGIHDDDVDAFTQVHNFIAHGPETTADKWKRSSS